MAATPRALPAGMTFAEAPIEDVRVVVGTSLPPQYSLAVRAGLPSGCARVGGHEVLRTADEVRVNVYNFVPTGNVACTQIYSSYDLSVDLGSGFTAGREYRVVVNGKAVTFRAQ